jgi:hypothetical protein
MSLNLWMIGGPGISATDGTVGAFMAVVFDDPSSIDRSLAVDTLGWLLGRKVLLPPFAPGTCGSEIAPALIGGGAWHSPVK